MSGKNLNENNTDLISNSLSDYFIHSNDLFISDKSRDIEDKILSIEFILKYREYLCNKLELFTNKEDIIVQNLLELFLINKLKREI